MKNLYQNFNWFIGVVEDNEDPERLGRCKVRIYGYHNTDTIILPTEDLPWSIPISPITSASISGVGSTPLGAESGTWVVGFFLDGQDMQQPAFFGTLGASTAPVAFKEKVEEVEESSLNVDDGIVKDEGGNDLKDTAGNFFRTATAQVDDHELGKTSISSIAKQEPGFIGENTEDPKGVVYGKYELASFLPERTPAGTTRQNSKNSPVLVYINQSKYKTKFEGLTPATEEFNDVWKELAAETGSGGDSSGNAVKGQFGQSVTGEFGQKVTTRSNFGGGAFGHLESNPTPSTTTTKSPFEQDQDAFFAKNYFGSLNSKLKTKGINLENHGPAVQDMIFSTALDYGPNQGVEVISEALKDKPKLSDNDVLAITTNFKNQSIDKFFKSKSQDEKDKLLSKFKTEQTDLNNLANPTFDVNKGRAVKGNYGQSVTGEFGQRVVSDGSKTTHLGS